nr:hypothetical protein [Tanacetum cinerariifolium]
QAEQELLQTTRDFHSCRQEEGHLGHPVTLGLGTVNELHAMLKLHEQTLPKSNAPALNAIRAGKGLRASRKLKPGALSLYVGNGQREAVEATGHKKSHSQKGAKGQNQGKMKFAPKTKIPPPPKRENPAKDSICHECGEIGHWKRNCPQDLAQLIKKKKNTASGDGGSGIFVIELNTILNRSWIYDTGCGTHIYNTTQGLRASRKLKPGALSLYVGNGQRKAVEATGAFYLCLHSGLEIVLNNCHYAPSITRGVISFSRLYEDGFVNRFIDNTIHVSRNNVVYFCAIPRDGIFEIDLSNSLTNESSVYAVSNKRAKLDSDSALLWHCRLRHISKKRIEKLKHDGLLNSSDLTTFEKCVSCMSVFQKEVENQLGKTIKSLCSDRAGEYMSQEFLDHLKDHGIIAHRTPPYTPQHNGNLKETMRYSFYYLPENKVLVARNAEFLKNSLIDQEASGSLKDLEIIQEEDTHPSLDTSLNHEEEDLEIDEPQSDIVPIRRSTRTRHAPDHMCLYIDAEEHELGDLGEPANYKVALLDPESEKWLNAMNVEMQSMKDNEVWVLVELPPNGKTVGSKWLFKKKTDMDGNVHIYKTRLVAKGLTQTPRIDYEETFSLVPDIRAIRILIAIAAYYDYEIWQMDVKTAFLNGYLNEEFTNSVFRGFFEKQKIIGPNFIDRYRQLKIVLSVEDKLDYLEQPIPSAPVSAGEQIAPEALAAHTAWVKGSKEIVGLMLKTMEPDIQRNLEKLSAYDMLQELKTLFAQQAEQELLQTVRDFHSCKQEEDQSVSSYVLKMKSYINNLEPDPCLLTLDMGKTVNELHAMLKLHEQTLTKKDPPLHAIWAGKVQKKNNKPKKPHVAAWGKNQEKGEKQWKRNCPQYLAELLKTKKLSQGASGSGIFTIELYTFPNKSWVYDTGCCTHICNTTQGLRRSKKLKPGALSLYVGNGQRAAVEAIGTYHLCLPSGLVIVLNNCHYVPSITRGIVSFSRLYDDGYVNRFVDNAISVSWNNLVYFSVVPRDGIFEIDLSNPNAIDSSMAFEKCVFCMSGKMARKPYTHQVKRAKDLLGLIHTNVCGPFKITSRQGANYFITFTDDFSRYGYVYLLKHKHEVFETYKVFQKEVENQLENSLITQEASGSLEDLEIIQEKYTHSSIDTSLNHEEDDLEIEEPQSDIILIRRSTRTWHAPDRMCLHIDAEEHELGDLGLNLSPNGKTVGSKWLFKKKTDMDGAVHIYKARLVAKGYTQTPGIDYEETFSLVADIRVIRILIAIDAFYDYEIWQIDQASRQWNKRFDDEIKKFGFTQNRDEPCVYLKASGSNVTFLILYANDILIMGNNIPMLQDVKSYLGRCFAMKDLGKAAYILGIKIYKDRSRRLIGLCQSAYIEKILKRFHMKNSKRESIPMQEKLRLSKSQGASTHAELKRMQNNITSGFQQKPGDLHWTTVKNILKYLRNTKDMFLVYGGDINRELMSTKKSIFATSSAKAEYIAAYDASKEAVWVRKFISRLGVVPTIEEPINMYCDNTGAITIANESGITKGLLSVNNMVVLLHKANVPAPPRNKVLAPPGGLTEDGKTMFSTLRLVADGGVAMVVIEAGIIRREFKCLVDRVEKIKGAEEINGGD